VCSRLEHDSLTVCRYHAIPQVTEILPGARTRELERSYFLQPKAKPDHSFAVLGMILAHLMTPKRSALLMLKIFELEITGEDFAASYECESEADRDKWVESLREVSTQHHACTVDAQNACSHLIHWGLL